jgi:hypothetical protein
MPSVSKKFYEWDETPLVVMAVAASAAAVLGFIYNFPVPQTVGSFLLFSIAAVCLHELGHALAAVSAGGSVHYIQLGRSYRELPLWSFNFLGFRWMVYSIPLSGLVRASFFTTSYYRLRTCWMIVAGPLINILGVVPAFLLIDQSNSARWTNLLVSWLFANRSVLLYTVLPRTYRYAGRSLPNDGLLVWHTLCYSDQDVERFVRHAVQTRELKDKAGLAETLSLPELLDRHEADPMDLIFLWHAVNKMNEENDSRYLQYTLKLLSSPQISEKSKADLIDSCLTWQLHAGPPMENETIDRLSLQLLAYDDSITARGTRGSILIDLDRVEEGKVILKDVLEKTKSPVDKSYANTFLALAEKRQGNIDLARFYAREALKSDPHAVVLKRIPDLLAFA